MKLFLNEGDVVNAKSKSSLTFEFLIAAKRQTDN